MCQDHNAEWNEYKSDPWRRLRRSTWTPYLQSLTIVSQRSGWNLKLCSILLRLSPKRITTPKLVVLVKQQATRSPQVFCGGRRAYSSHPQFKDKTAITSWCTPYEGARCINCFIEPEKLTYIYTLVYAMILKLYSLTLYYQVIDQQLTCIETLQTEVKNANLPQGFISSGETTPWVRSSIKWTLILVMNLPVFLLAYSTLQTRSGEARIKMEYYQNGTVDNNWIMLCYWFRLSALLRELDIYVHLVKTKELLSCNWS